MKATPLFAPLALAAVANANIVLPQRNDAAIVDRAPQHDDSAWQDPQAKNRGQSGVLVSTDTTAYSRGPLASPVSITSALPVTGTPAGEGPLPTLPKLSSDTRTNPGGGGGAPQTSDPGSFVVQTTMPTNTQPAVPSNGAGGSSAAASSSAPAAASSSSAAASVVAAQRGPVVAVAAMGMAAAALVL